MDDGLLAETLAQCVVVDPVTGPRVQGGLGDNDMPGSELEMNLFFKHMTLILRVQDSLTIVHSQLNLNHMSILYHS